MLRGNTRRVKKIGIYAGTFDPIHSGHIELAEAAHEQAKLDKVFFLVEPRPRRKQGVKALEHRVAMVQLNLKDKKDFGTIILEQSRFTVDQTLPLLKARFKGAELHLLMGDDVLDHLSGWPHIETLAQVAKLVIAPRKSTPNQIDKQLISLFATKGLHFDYQILKDNLPVVSSSSIKRALRAGRQPEEVSDKVYKYIKKHKLYVSGEGS